MKFPAIDHLLTGTAVAVSALKTNENSGVGEYLDLMKLADWCAKTGIEVIQLLPVNDTGFETSPYAALSAFALHPLFIRLSALPGAHLFAKDIEQVREWHKDAASINFFNILKDKWAVFDKIFDKQFDLIDKDADLAAWIKANPWVIEYSVFSVLKHRNQLNGWQSWKEMREPSAKDIQKFWDAAKNRKECLLFAWLQYQAEKQFIEAAVYCGKKGVSLKGDLPILLNEDSADVWAHPELFDLSMRAGAPPDAFSAEGQNWGFPTYRWDNLAKQDYQWWKDRLKQADKFYHAYRIDHVLGFFRIWATAAAESSALLGYFNPVQTISRNQLTARGFDEGRITWLSQPHIYGQELRDRLGHEWETALAQALVRIGSEDLFKFKPEIKGEKALAALTLSEGAKAALGSFWRNRTLIDLGNNAFLPIYTYRGTRGYDSLSQDEKWRFDNLVAETAAQSEAIWEKQGDKLMKLMTTTTPMLVCAEDLGVIPDCVPVVLARHEILSLKIVRWAREYKKPGEPYLPIGQYPLLSVCTPSVHDTSTLRQWWLEDAQKAACLDSLGLHGLSGQYTVETAEKVLGAIAGTSSLLCMFAIQDLFALKGDYLTANPAEERVNTPGTVSPANWNYKIKPSLETLIADKDFTQKIETLTKGRKARKVKLSKAGK